MPFDFLVSEFLKGAFGGGKSRGKKDGKGKEPPSPYETTVKVGEKGQDQEEVIVPEVGAGSPHSGLMQRSAALVPGAMTGNIYGQLSGGRGGGKGGPGSAGLDPLQAQLQFFQLIRPFLQEQAQSALQGMTQTADQYEQRMGSAIQNLSPEMQSYFEGVVPNVAQTMRNLGAALMTSANATPEYEMLMAMVQSLREQQERDVQNQMMIQMLQQELARARQAATQTTQGMSGNPIQDILGGLGGSGGKLTPTRFTGLANERR